MKYDFDQIVNRENSDSIKYDLRKALFGKEDVLPFWVADMDFKTPDFIIKALHKRLDHELLGYSLKSDRLNTFIVNWLERQHGWPVQKKWITINPGVVPTLGFCALTYTRPGDQIIIQTPVYYPFFYTIENNGRQILNNPLVMKNGRYSMDLKDLEDKITSRTKMIFLCNPHNPGGSVWRKDELQQLAEICLKNNILVISDEIHSDLILYDNKHIPFATLGEEIAANTITCLSASKTFNMAGLGISYTVISNPELRTELNNKLNDFHLSFGNVLGLRAMEAAYEQGEEWLGQLLRYIEENIDFIQDYLKKNIPDVSMVKPEGTYLVWLDFRKLGLSQDTLNKFLIREAGLGMSNGTQFGVEGKGFQRLNTACPRSLIIKGLEQLEEAINPKNS